MESNSQDTTSGTFQDFFETLEEFLETYEAADAAVPPPQLCAPLTAQNPTGPHTAPEVQDILHQLLEETQIPGPPRSQAQASPNEPTQNQASALDLPHNVPQVCESVTALGQGSAQEPPADKDRALAWLPEEEMEESLWDQYMSRSAQRIPTAASQMARDTDVLSTFSGDQTLTTGSTETSGDEQTPSGIKMPLSGTQILNGIQTFTGNRMPTHGVQIPCGGMTFFTGDQTQSGSQMSFTAHQNENAGQMPFSVDKFIEQDSTMEGHSQEMSTDAFPENPEESLQVDPAVLQPQLCAPPTPQGPGSTREPPGGQDILDQLLKELQIPGPDTPQAQCGPNEPTQTQARVLDPLPTGPQFPESLVPQHQDSPQGPTEDKDPALDQLLEELMEMPSRGQNRNCSAQSNPTAVSQVSHDCDMLKTFSGDPSLSGVQTKTSGSEQTPCGNQMPYSGTQIINGSPMPFIDAQMLWGNLIPFREDQTPGGSQTSFTSITGQQAGNGTQTSMSMNQTFNGNQVPFNGAQVLWVNQVPFTINGNHIVLNGDQNHYGVQMTPVTGLPTRTFIGTKTSTGCQPVPQSGTQNLYGIQMVPQVLPLPQSGFIYANAHLVQGQSQKPNNPKSRSYLINAEGQRRYVCTFQGCGKEYTKVSHLRIHERNHTGERPYVCDVTGCTWRFRRSDELRRHKKTHTGERPHRCPHCHKEFARSDHVKQHARVHEKRSTTNFKPTAGSPR